MGRTQYYTATSIDGFIADEHNSLDWLFGVGAGADPDAGDSQKRFQDFFGGVGAMAMGATTYEWVLEHDNLLTEPAKWHGYYGDTPCWIFTHRDLPPIPGVDLRFVQGDVAGVHAEMVAAAGDRNRWIVGGGELVGQFADHGLLDEVQLGVAPVFLGAGAPLLPRKLLSAELTLAKVEHDAYFVHLTYTVNKP
ncbi:dihydrofolate reductase [Allocatelliglobosispora scoriae]|uniref:Dihydrofolate reductase n=1 Tax=Allocatelliglobosispora scoriae TaxID=643052 RepID=A0A841BKU5_9ACTN|nr:dihydrofolate reductase family protein [Allocatelliglobosispora scoriae]MBB5868904.1 dihydrofolate reductase [Allocatelliglobosispora scoriae]